MDSLTPVLKKRMFVAATIPIDQCPKFKSFFSKLKKTFHEHDIDLKWVPPANWHITIWFLGETAEDEIAIIRQTLKDIAVGTAPIEINLRGAGAFPDEFAARVLWAGAATTRELRHLHEQVGEKLGRKSEQDFVAHVTLGRLRNPCSIKKILSPFSRQKLDKIEIRELLLIESQMQNYGTTYKIIDRFSMVDVAD